MGIHISVRKVIEKKTEPTWGGKTEVYYISEEQSWFDYIRHSGDADFATENEFVNIDSDAPIREQELVRPKDFNKCREWVKNMQYPEGNKQRLLKALDEMEKDESLAFAFVW